MTKKRSRTAESPPLRVAEQTDAPRAASSDHHVYTPRDLPGVIPEARRDYALWQARSLAARLAEQIRNLESYAKEHDRSLERINRAWVAWELGGDPQKLERLSLLRKLAELAHLVDEGRMNCAGCALVLLSLPGVKHRLEESANTAFQRAHDLTIRLLESWNTQTRHSTGGGKWPLAARLVKEIWGVSLDARTLSVEFSRAIRGGSRESPEKETLELIKARPRMMRPPGRGPAR